MDADRDAYVLLPPFTSRDHLGNNIRMEDRVLAIAASVAATFTNTNATEDNTTAMATFKATVSTCNGRLLLMGVGC